MRELPGLRAAVVAFVFYFAAAGTGFAGPKNIILMIGDGMGKEAVKAAGLYANGKAGTLSFEAFPVRGQVRTASADNTVTDSAAGATAIATGRRVNNGVISRAIPGDGKALTTLLEYFKAKGKRTGIVTTDVMTGGTPAAFGAHQPTRKRAALIAADYLTRTRPNVLFGGGGNGLSASRAAAAGYLVVKDRAAMQAPAGAAVAYVSDQFGAGVLPYEFDGTGCNNEGAWPRLTEMVLTALSKLSEDPDGFFLMVEGGNIDHAGHINGTKRIICETLEFSNAAGSVRNWAAGRADTLIVVTADHETGGLAVVKNNGAGNWPTVTWGGSGHTAADVPLYAWGLNAARFSGPQDNTGLYAKFAAPDPDSSGALPAPLLQAKEIRR